MIRLASTAPARFLRSDDVGPHQPRLSSLQTHTPPLRPSTYSPSSTYPPPPPYGLPCTGLPAYSRPYRYSYGVIRIRAWLLGWGNAIGRGVCESMSRADVARSTWRKQGGPGLPGEKRWRKVGAARERKGVNGGRGTNVIPVRERTFTSTFPVGNVRAQ